MGSKLYCIFSRHALCIRYAQRLACAHIFEIIWWTHNYTEGRQQPADYALEAALLENELNSFWLWEEGEYALSVSTIACVLVSITLRLKQSHVRLCQMSKINGQ